MGNCNKAVELEEGEEGQEEMHEGISAHNNPVRNHEALAQHCSWQRVVDWKTESNQD